jgi:dUTP pyrophosphatase
MDELKVLVAKKESARIPEYATPSSSGMDLRASLTAPVTLQPLERTLIPTGIFLAIPRGYEAEIRPRSGLAHNSGITVLNTPGTIDADYRGEVKVILINLGGEPFRIEDGDRVAQMVFKRVERAQLVTVDLLPETERGQGGFGSTGIRD